MSSFDFTPYGLGLSPSDISQVSNDNFYRLKGFINSSWDSWTPTFTGLSGGTINYAKYTQFGKTVFFRVKYTFAGADVSASVYMTLPVPANDEYAGASNNREPIGTAFMRDSSATVNAIGIVYFIDTDRTKVQITVLNASGTYLAPTSLSATVPFTWEANDTLQIVGSYEAK